MGNTQTKNTLSIVTFNTLGTPILAPDITKRYREIAKLINKESYDVVCLQELFTYYHLFLFRKLLSAFPYICYQKNIIGPRGGLVIFSKIPLKNQDFITYTFPFDAHVPFYTKVVQNGILSATVGTFHFRICTTHLSSDIVHNLSPKDKFYKLILSQSQEAALALSNYSKNEESVCMVGDFNIAKNSTLYQDFLRSTQAVAVFVKENSPTYDPERINYFYKAVKPDRIDHMFLKSASKKIKVVTTNQLFLDKVVFPNNRKGYLSDHIGLHCILKFDE